MIPDTFAAFDNPIKIQLGTRVVTFKLGRDGEGEINGGTFRAENVSRNSSERGMIYGGWLKFDLTLSGKDWASDLIANGLKTNATAIQQISMPLTVEIADSKFHTGIEINAGSP